jgi:hypothetical protein
VFRAVRFPCIASQTSHHMKAAATNLFRVPCSCRIGRIVTQRAASRRSLARTRTRFIREHLRPDCASRNWQVATCKRCVYVNGILDVRSDYVSHNVFCDLLLSHSVALRPRRIPTHKPPSSGCDQLMGPSHLLPTRLQKILCSTPLLRPDRRIVSLPRASLAGDDCTYALHR